MRRRVACARRRTIVSCQCRNWALGQGAAKRRSPRPHQSPPTCLRCRHLLHPTHLCRTDQMHVMLKLLAGATSRAARTCRRRRQRRLDQRRTLYPGCRRWEWIPWRRCMTASLVRAARQPGRAWWALRSAAQSQVRWAWLLVPRAGQPSSQPVHSQVHAVGVEMVRARTGIEAHVRGKTRRWKKWTHVGAGLGVARPHFV